MNPTSDFISFANYNEILQEFKSQIKKIDDVELNMYQIMSSVNIKNNEDMRNELILFFSKRFDCIELKINSMELKLNSMELKLNSMESRLNSMESRLNSMDDKMNEILSKLSEIVKK